MKQIRNLLMVLTILPVQVFAANPAQDKFVSLVKENKCDQAEKQAHLIFKGSELLMARGFNLYFCRGDQQAGIALIKKSAEMGNKNAHEALQRIKKQNDEAQANQARCDDAYAIDATYSKHIKEIQDVYGQEIEATRSQGTSAFLLGAGGTGGIGETLSSAGRASMPYTDRINRLAFERDSKIRDIRYKQSQLRIENQRCFP